jgi:hypothetical protein
MSLIKHSTIRYLSRGILRVGPTAEGFNIQAVIKSNLFGLLLGSTLAASFYLARRPLTIFFLPNDPNPIQKFKSWLKAYYGLIW